MLTLIRDLQQHLAIHERAGRWQSADSSLLAWSCGQELSAQIDLYVATRKREWLDQLVRHADAMFAHLSRNREGFLSWRSRSYSSLRIQVRPAKSNPSTFAIEPAEQWLRQAQSWTRELLRPALTGQPQALDWEYHLTWREGSKVDVRGATTKKLLSTVAVRVGEGFQPLPGVKLTMRVAPAVGDRFILSVQEPKDFDFAVHDGVILTAICRFIALVRADPELQRSYGQHADAYLKVIRSDLIPKWNPYWRDCGDGGLLVAHVDEALTYPGISLPHNQYLALGNALIWLHRITGDSAYRDQAAKMARCFKSHLRLVDDHYDWNYWDAVGQPVVAWEAKPVDINVDEALAADADGERGDRQAAANWLQHALANGPVKSTEILQDAKDNGISEKTLRRAKDQIGVHAFKNGCWYWTLSDQDGQPSKPGHLADDGVQGGQDGQDGPRCPHAELATLNQSGHLGAAFFDAANSGANGF